MANPSCLRLLTHWVRRAASRADCTAGNNRAIRTAMMAMTTRSSMSVKARRFRNSTTHPPFQNGRVRNRRTHADAERKTTGLILGWVAYLLPHHEPNGGARTTVGCLVHYRDIASFGCPATHSGAAPLSIERISHTLRPTYARYKQNLAALACGGLK